MFSAWVPGIWEHKEILGTCLFPTWVPGSGGLGSREAVLSIQILGTWERKTYCQRGCFPHPDS